MVARVQVPKGAEARLYTWGLTGELGVKARAFSAAVYEHGKLPLREFEAVRIRIAQLNGCRLCMAFRTSTDHPSGRGNGEIVPEEFYAAVEFWATSPLLTARERIAVEYAERYATEPRALAVDGGFWARLTAAFSDAEIAEIGMAVAAFFTLGRFSHVMGIDDVCEMVPPPHPTRRQAERANAP